MYWPYLDPSDEIAVEDFYRRALFLFKPWKSENDLKSEDQTYIEAFDSYVNEINENARNDILRYM